MFFWTETRATRVRITPKNTLTRDVLVRNLIMYGTRGTDGSSFYTDTLF